MDVTGTGVGQTPDLQEGLRMLVGYLGPAMVAEILGISEADLPLLLEGRAVLGPEAAGNYRRLRETVQGAAPPGELPAEVPPETASVPPPGIPVDSQDVRQAFSAEGSGGVQPPSAIVPGRTGFTPGEEDERRRATLRKARSYAVMTQFRLDIDRTEWLAAVSLVARMDLYLIYCYGESVPEPGQFWDANRREREKDRRMHRMRWAENELRKEHSGVQGIWNRLTGRDRVNGRELYQRMVRDVDNMFSQLEQGFPATVLDEARDLASLMR